MRYLIIIIFLLPTSFLFAQSKLPKCKGSDFWNYSNCFGEYIKSSGTKYIGEWKDGKEHGQGTLIVSNGGKYIGEWKDGKRTGKGTANYADGSIYVGEWKDGKRHGKGKTVNNNDEYVGDYFDDKQHGNGTLKWSDGTKYTGSWKFNKMAEGLLEFKEGSYSHYKGKFLDDKFHGYGELTFRDGSNYSGGFNNGKLDDYGVFTNKGEEFLLEHKNGAMVYASNLNETSNKNRDIDLESIVDILLSSRGSGGYGDIISSGLNAMSRQSTSSANQMKPLIERSVCTEIVISRSPYIVREVCR